MTFRQNPIKLLSILLASLAFIPVSHAADEVRTVDLGTADIAYDPASGMIYAGVRSGASRTNAIIPINPATGELGEPIPLDSAPVRLALSGDGKALYVGLDGGRSVARLDLTTKTWAAPFTLGTDAEGAPYTLLEMEAVPGAPDAVVISRRNNTPGLNFGGAALYVGGFQKGVATSTSAPAFESLEFGADGSQLYGVSQPRQLTRMTVDDDGVHVADTTDPGLNLGGLDVADGHIFTAHGPILDAATLTLEDTSIRIASPQSVLADPTSNRIFYLTSGPGAKIHVYHLISRASLGVINVPALAPAGRLIRWGNDGLAFSDPSRIFLIRSSHFPPEGVSANLAVTQEVSPASALTGRTLTYTLTAENRGPDSATGATLTHRFPLEGEFVSAGASQGTCFAVRNVVTCGLGDLAPGAKAAVTVALSPVFAGAFATTSRLSGHQADPDTKDNVIVHRATVEFGLESPGAVGGIRLRTNDLAYDPLRKKIYASVPAAGENGNSVAVIDPVTGAVGPYLPVGSEPGRLAISDNGQYLYVGLNGENAIRRVTLETFTTDQWFSLSVGNETGLYAADMEVLPGHPESVAVVRKQLPGPVTPSSYSTAIFDRGRIRGKTTPDSQGGTVITFGGSAAVLYGYDNDSSDHGFYRMSVDENGITTRDVWGEYSNLIKAPDAYYEYVDLQTAGGLLYASSGRVIDPERLTLLGSFAGRYGTHNLVRPDPATDRVFFLNLLMGRTVEDRSYQLREYDLSTRVPLGSIDLPGVLSTPTSFIRWGPDGLAFRTSSAQVFFVRASTVPPLTPVVDLSVRVSASPDPVLVGESLTYTVTVANNGDGTATGVGLQNDFVPNTRFISVTPSQGTCTPFGAAATPSSAVSCNLGAIPKGATAQVTLVLIPLSASVLKNNFRAAGLQKDPDLANNQSSVQIDAIYSLSLDQSTWMPAGVTDLVYDAHRGKIYASRQGDHLHPGRTIITFDPATGRIENTMEVGISPGEMAISEDGRYLYVALEESASVKRIDLNTLESDLEFPVGTSPFRTPLVVDQMEAVPGQPESVMISRREKGPGGSASGIAVYRNGVPAVKSDPYFQGASVFEATEDPSRWYGKRSDGSNFELFELKLGTSDITPNGLIIEFSNPPPWFGADFDYAGGYLFTSGRLLIDMNERKYKGVYGDPVYTHYGESLVSTDVPLRRVYYVQGDDPNSYSSSFALKSYDIDTLGLVGAMPLPGPGTAPPAGPIKSLVRWGVDGIAFIGPNGQVCVARSSLIPRVYGDANGDRKFDIQDVVTALQFTVGLQIPGPDGVARADVAPKPGPNGQPYGDGIVDVLDAVLLLRALVGLEFLP